MNIIGIIPARMASSRFPGKPLAKICGKPMIWHVMKNANRSMLNEVYVATCDKEIYDYVQSVGGNAIMTSDKHERGTDRIAEALIKIEKEYGKRPDIVVNLQGDEPMVTPEMINDAIRVMVNDENLRCVNLMSPLTNDAEACDPNEVKVVVDKDDFAMYFSREPIPSRMKYKGKVESWKQVCVIPFRRDFLIRFTKMKQTPLEIIESIDMLRVIENGGKVKMVRTNEITYSVDTLSDLKLVDDIMSSNI